MYVICKYNNGVFLHLEGPIYAFEKRAMQARDLLQDTYGLGAVVYEVEEVSDMINYERGD